MSADHPISSPEIWKVAIDTAGYEISDWGRVRSWRRLKDKSTPKILRPRPMKSGHVQVSVLLAGRGRQDRLVHHLVLEAFVGPCPSGMECRHLDGNPRNNRLDNLAWGTRKQNRQDSIDHGTIMRGERHYQAKLSDAKVREMRRLKENGMSYSALAEMFGVAPSVAHEAVKGFSWRHVI